jgi:hypothetical protein
MLSNAVVTSAGGLATEPALTRPATHVPIVVTSAFTGARSGLFAHPWIVVASDAAVEASMLGHAAATFAWKSAQKLCIAADIEAAAEPDGSIEASTEGATVASTDGATVGASGVAAGEVALEPVDEHAATAIAATPIRASVERRMDMSGLQDGRITGWFDRRGASVPSGGIAGRHS